MRNFKEWFFLLSLEKRIGLVVLALHLLVLLILSLGGLFTFKKKRPPSIAVRTVVQDTSPLSQNNLKNREFDKEGSLNLRAERAPLALGQDANGNKISETKPIQSNTDSSSCFDLKQQRVAPSSSPKVTEKKKTSPPPQKVSKPVAFKKIEKKPSPKKPSKTAIFSEENLKVPPKISLKPKSTPLESMDLDPSYEENLILFLQSELDLPETGDVQLELELDLFGRLISCQTIRSKSQNNEKFLKEQLPLLHFPSPHSFGPSKKTKKFLITFKSEFFYH